MIRMRVESSSFLECLSKFWENANFLCEICGNEDLRSEELTTPEAIFHLFCVDKIFRKTNNSYIPKNKSMKSKLEIIRMKNIMKMK